ncbi:MAG: hypothetical protein P8184_05610 [Calditrichia bacterium]
MMPHQSLPYNDNWTAQEMEILQRLSDPPAIQAFLDSIPYSEDPIYRWDRKAHCFDGALFAACALRRLGHKPLIIDMLAERDDDHMLALFKRDNCWGAVAKSNFVGLRFREPVYRTLRELVMSYFEFYYNVEAEKTLRGYTFPLDMSKFDGLNWTQSDAHLEVAADRFDHLRRVSIVTPAMSQKLSPVDERTYRAGMQGVNEAGLYHPPPREK